MKLKELREGGEGFDDITSLSAYSLVNLSPETELVRDEFMGRTHWTLPREVIDRYDNLVMARRRAREMKGQTTRWHRELSLKAALSFLNTSGIAHDCSLAENWDKVADEIISLVNKEVK